MAAIQNLARLIEQTATSEHLNDEGKLEQIRLDAFLFSRHPHLFDSDEFFMKGPTVLVMGILVTARSRVLVSKFTYEWVGDQKAIGNPNPILDAWARAADELAAHVMTLRGAGIVYCPYIPLQIVRAVDADTWAPLVGFKTRFGLINNNGKAMGEEEYAKLYETPSPAATS